MRLSQSAFAQRIGAANKAVVYQWESRKRTPSPVLWQRVLALTASDTPPVIGQRDATLR
jgi:DNA-binding transcriptional regulator YiaG